jgi:hypothetical protein
MDFINPQNAAAYGIGGMIVVAIVSILVKDGLVKLIAFLSERGAIANQKLKNDVDDEEKDDTLERETRQIVNAVAVDTRKQLSELQTKYIEQSEVVTKQIADIHKLGTDLANCRDVVVIELKRQVALLLEQVNELEATRNASEYKDTDA